MFYTAHGPASGLVLAWFWGAPEASHCGSAPQQFMVTFVVVIYKTCMQSWVQNPDWISWIWISVDSWVQA